MPLDVLGLALLVSVVGAAPVAEKPAQRPAEVGQIAAAGAAQPPSQAPREGLVAYYPFDGDARDASGNERHGVALDVNRDRDVGGDRDGSFRFNDEDDRVTLPIDINPATLPQVTLVAWVKPATPWKRLVVFSNDDDHGKQRDRALLTALKGNRPVWVVSDGKGGLVGGLPVRDREWTFVAARYDGARGLASVHVDGHTISGKAEVAAGLDELLVGTSPDEGSEAAALIDEVYVYGRLLGDAELDALRQLKQVAPPSPIPEPAVASYVAVREQPVREKPDGGARQVGTLEAGAQLGAGSFGAIEKDPRGDPWLAVTLPDGKKGYARAALLEAKEAEAPKPERRSRLESFVVSHFDLGKAGFWVVVALALALGLLGAASFESIDEAIGQLTDSDFTNYGWFPVVTSFLGAFLAVFLVFAQESVEYLLFENPTLWPDGYGFASWMVWVIALLGLLALAGMLVESLVGAGPRHGLLRAALLLVLGAVTFVSSVVLGALVMVVAIILAVVLAGVVLAGASAVVQATTKVIVVRRD